MAEKKEGGLPLHDEAKARSKWRDGETFIDGGDDGASGPASAVDEAGRSDSAIAQSPPLDGLSKRPPD